MNLPEDLLRLIVKLCDDGVRKKVCQALSFEQLLRTVSVTDDKVADLNAIQNAVDLILEHQNVSKVTLQCEHLSVTKCQLAEVNCPKLKDLFVQGSAVNFHRQPPLKKLFLGGGATYTTWPYGPIQRLQMDTSIRFAEGLAVKTHFLEINKTFGVLDLSFLKSWTFEELSIDMDPVVFLNYCLSQGLQFDCKAFDVSFLRMFQFDQSIFQKIMRVMPQLTKLSARGCNWSPALSLLLEDNLKQWPQICKVDLDDNFAIESWSVPLKSFSARGLFKNHGSFMFQNFAQWPLEHLSVDVTDESLEAFFQFLSRSPCKSIEVWMSKVQTSDKLLQLSAQYVSNVQVPQLTFHFSQIQKVSQTWFAQLKRIWSAKYVYFL